MNKTIEVATSEIDPPHWELETSIHIQTDSSQFELAYDIPDPDVSLAA